MDHFQKHLGAVNRGGKEVRKRGINEGIGETDAELQVEEEDWNREISVEVKSKKASGEDGTTLEFLEKIPEI